MMLNRTEVALNQVLRPETVLALENVRFVLRARAMPGVEEASESIGEVSFVGKDDDEDEDLIDVAHEMRLKPDHEERQVVVGGFIVAGGLCYDDDASHLNPFENDGGANGKLYHGSSRDASPSEVAEYFDALGLDGHGNKNLDAEAVSDYLAKRVIKGIGDDLSLFTRLIHRLRATGRQVSKASLNEVVQSAIDREGWQYGLDNLVEALYGVSHFDRLRPDVQDALAPLADLFSESEAESAWDDARDAGKIGKPFVVLLDIYEHGGRVYSVSGSGMQCRWDTSRGGAVWVPDGDALDNIRYAALQTLGGGQLQWFGNGTEDNPSHVRYSMDDGKTWIGEGMGWKWSQALDAMLQASGKRIDQKALDQAMEKEAERYCRSILEEYNAWVNGDVHGVVVYVIDRKTGERIEDHDDECWGFIGSQYAEQELEATVLSKVLQLGSTLH